VPLYEFKCPVCSTTAEVVQAFEADAPLCASDDNHVAKMDRQVSVPYRAIIVKGCTGAQLGNH
jgi:putative FmdB family regulatory protein